MPTKQLSGEAKNARRSTVHLLHHMVATSHPAKNTPDHFGKRTGTYLRFSESTKLEFKNLNISRVLNVKFPHDALSFPKDPDSEGIPLDVIYELFKFHYNMFWLEVDPADSGHSGVSRPRIYIFLSHMETGKVLRNPIELYDQLSHEIKKRIQTVPSDYWCATSREIMEEALELAGKSKIPYQCDTWLGLDNRPFDSRCSFMFQKTL